MNIDDLTKKLDTTALLETSLTDWRPILAQECQVYVMGENYIAKRFDAINYKFCEKTEAKEVLIDNLYALLRYKYFPKSSEEIDERIQKIVQSFTINLKSTLKKVSFDDDVIAEKVSMLPDYCMPFRNGVYDFLHNKWLFKYEIIKMKKINNVIYLYDPKWIITWYMDFDFEPLPIDITHNSLTEVIKMFKNISKSKKERNFCFELMYNISHDMNDVYSEKRFKHLCEILGYTVLQSFCQAFVLLIGSGQNGKNSLFDGCFTSKVRPTPAANDLDAIENDRFVTGSLINKAHNIFLETSAKTYTESKMLKALTGSPYQTIESKGVSKYSGFINCKYIFAGNDQEKIKFSDSTIGFRRRINVFETWYKWDAQKRFLKRGDYYDTTFSDDLRELKSDLSNTIAYIYFAMFGLMSATKCFTQTFKFTENDWRLSYTDVDMDLKEKIEKVNPVSIVKYIKRANINDVKYLFYDINKTKLYESSTLKELGYFGFDDLIKFLEDDETFTSYFANNDVYMSIRSLQIICGDLTSPTAFTQAVKKLYSLNSLQMLAANKPYVKCTFVGKRLKIVN